MTNNFFDSQFAYLLVKLFGIIKYKAVNAIFHQLEEASEIYGAYRKIGAEHVYNLFGEN